MRGIVVFMLLLAACSTEGRPPPAAATAPGPTAEDLVTLLTIDNPRLIETADLIANTGDARVQDLAGDYLANLAIGVASNHWLDAQAKGALASHSEPGTEALRQQERLLVRIYAAMSRLRTPSVHAHCRLIHRDPRQSLLHRRLARDLLVAHGFALPPEEPPGATARGANVVVANLRQPFKACYQDELRRNREAQGSVTLVAKIDATGRVVDLSSSATALSNRLVTCLARVVRGAAFWVSEGGSAVVTIPITFVKR